MADIPPTRSEWADARLREAILSGELSPGERLVPSLLSERWAVSATPLREAFQRLAGEGLVELIPQRGARVAPVSRRDMSEIYELRMILEPLALRRSLARVDDAWRVAVRESHRELRRTLARRQAPLMDLEEAHRVFHGALLSRCDSSWLLRLVDSLAQHSMRYRLLSLAPRGGPGEVAEEHDRLLEACMTGDTEAASAHLERHLSLTVESISRDTSTVELEPDGRRRR